jgi:voltage-gated sodium channel
MTTFFKKIKDSNTFKFCVLFLILASSIVLGLNTYDFDESSKTIFQTVLNVISLFFVLEIIIRILGEEQRFNFFKDPWNNFDLAIVAVSLMPSAAFESILIFRLLRLFRILRFISFLPELRFLVEGLLSSFKSAFSIVIILLLVMFIYGVMGTTLYGDIAGFQNLGDSFLTLFQVLTLSSWEEIMRRTISAHPFSWIYFVTFIFIASIMVLNLFIAVLVDMVSKIRSDKK